jgi:hypothetical protein
MFAMSLPSMLSKINGWLLIFSQLVSLGKVNAPVIQILVNFSIHLHTLAEAVEFQQSI